MDKFIDQIILAFDKNEPDSLEEGLTGLVDHVGTQAVIGEDLNSVKHQATIVPPCLSEIFCQLLRQDNTSLQISTMILMSMPHIRPINNLNQAKKSTLEYIIRLLNSMDISPYAINKLKSFAISQGLVCLKLLGSDFDQSLQQFDVEKLIRFAEPWSNNSYSSVFNLQALDFFLSLNASTVQLDKHLLDRIVDKVVKPNISSPISKCRLFSLHIMTQLYPNKISFTRAYQSERIPPTLHEYREKVRLLSYLNSYSVEEDTFPLLPFRYLLPLTYINFSPLWRDIIDLLKSYIENTKYRSQAMELLFEHLQETNSIIYNNTTLEDETITIDFLNGSVPSSVVTAMNQLVSFVVDRIDPLNHRVLLFQTMSSFPDIICETNGGQNFMDAFFLFADRELKRAPFLERDRFEDLRKDKKLKVNQADLDEPDEFADSDDDEEQDEDEENPTEKDDVVGTKRLTFGRRMSRKMQTTRTFVELTKVIWSFKNISQIHRHEDLENLMLDLLSNRNTSIQHASFRCILAFNHPFLEPYVGNIFKILSDRTFKAGIEEITLEDGQQIQQVRDNLQPEVTTIQEEHRPGVVPLILRILYGKMIGKAGRKSAGRSKSDMRRSIVIRFISGCKDEEIQFFLDLAFEPYKKYTDRDYSKIEQVLSQSIDISRFIPLGKLQAMLATLTTIMELVANMHPNVLVFVMKVINISSYMVVQLINNERYNVHLHRGGLYRLKILRKQCYSLVDKFFDIFEYYNYSRAEINMIFDQLVWPMLSDLSDQSYAKPTPLLKLFLTWSGLTRFQRLLVKHKGDDYPLQRIVSLYSESRTQRPVAALIAHIFENLLFSPRPDDDGEIDYDHYHEELQVLDINDVRIPPYNKNDFKILAEPNFGTSILISSIPQILERLQENLRKASEEKKSSYHMEATELRVLSAISRYVKDPAQSQTSASLLLSSLSSIRSEERQLETTRAIQILMEQVITLTDAKFIKNLATLIGFQRGTNQRAELCKLLQVVAQKRPDLSEIVEVICLMNNYPSSQNQIDSLEARLKGFKRLFSYLEALTNDDMTDSISDALILVIYQTMNYISSSEQQDFTTRDNCLLFYEILASKFKHTRCGTLFQAVVVEIILDKGIKKGLRNTSETIRHLYIGILRAFALSCHAQNTTLDEFYSICNEKNPDLDFLINIRHIQLHNRSKALARLYGSERDAIISFTPKTLSSFLLPLATSFLFNRAYASLGSLVENSIKIVGLVSRVLNWNTYESVLTYYLENLVKANAKHQKTSVNLLTEIIKNFNFDLTSCPEAKENQEEEEKLEAQISRKQKKRNQLRDLSKAKPKEEHDFGISVKKLNPSTARHVYLSVTQRIIPKLNSTLHEVTRAEFEHDKQTKDELPEKDEIKRIPIAFAIVQLLNLLPGRRTLIRNHLPSIFLKLCSFLRSKSEPVRHAARVTIAKIMKFLGPDYFHHLLKELKQALHKGFQIHVLNFTIHSILEKLTLVYGDLDERARDLVSLSLEEIFGDIADDKEIKQILAKTPEAKKTKSYDTLMIVASVISHEALLGALEPLKALLKTTIDAKKVEKLSTCFKKFFTGLSHNEEFPLEHLLPFIRDIIVESIPSLTVSQTMEVPAKPTADVRQDRFLIVDDLPRDRLKAKINEKGNYYFVVENSLRLLLSVIQSKKVPQDSAQRGKLNEFVQLLNICLNARSPKSVARSLKCLYFIIKSNPKLPSLKSNSMKIVKRIFILLNKYNGIGMAQGENQEMIMMCFKTLNLLMGKSEEVNLTKDHLRALLSYVDQDINDIGRQATAFKTLKALLSRKLNSPELPEVMSKVSKLLIQSEDPNIRRISAQTWKIYLLNYPHGKTLQNHLITFVRQLEYPHVDGRIATLSLVNSIIAEFPMTIIYANRELLFLPLASRLINEESKEARKLVSQIIAKLLDRLDEKEVREIFDNMIVPWSKNESISLRTMSVKLMSIILETKIGIFSGSKFSRIKMCLDGVERELKPQSNPPEDILKENVTDKEQQDDSENSASEEEICDEEKIASSRIIDLRDRHIYHVLKLYSRILKFNLVETDDRRFASTLSTIWQNIANHYLTYWHLPVVILSCQLYSGLLSKYSPSELSATIETKSDSKSKDYVKRNAKQIVMTLCDKYIALIERVSESPELEDSLTRSLVFLGKVTLNLGASKKREKYDDIESRLEKIHAKDFSEDGFELLLEEDGQITKKRRLNFIWLSRKIIMQARKEVALKRSMEFYRRIFVFKWLAAMSVDLGSDRIINYAPAFLIPLCRELTDRTKISKEMLTLAEQVVNLIKQYLGSDTFNQVYTKVQLHITKKRLERKKSHAILKVTEQARGIKRKNRQRSEKKVNKKRKNFPRS